MIKHIGDRSKDGLLEIVDINCPALGVTTVTVRETMGGNCIIGGFPLSRARALAKATRYLPRMWKAPVVNRFVYNGCEHVTFRVSIID